MLLGELVEKIGLVFHYQLTQEQLSHALGELVEKIGLVFHCVNALF